MISRCSVSSPEEAGQTVRGRRTDARTTGETTMEQSAHMSGTALMQIKSVEGFRVDIDECGRCAKILQLNALVLMGFLQVRELPSVRSLRVPTWAVAVTLSNPVVRKEPVRP